MRSRAGLAAQPLPNAGAHAEQTPSSSSAAELDPPRNLARELDAEIIRELRRRQDVRKRKWTLLTSFVVLLGAVAYFYPRWRTTILTLSGAVALLVLRHMLFGKDAAPGHVPFSSSMGLLRLGSGAGGKGASLGQRGVMGKPSPRLQYLRKLKAERLAQTKEASKTRFGLDGDSSIAPAAGAADDESSKLE
jgi:hypothetical protein